MKFLKKLLSVSVSLCVMTAAVFASGDGKTVCVGAEETYKTVQEAVDAIAAEADTAGWTVAVTSGEYGCFTVPPSLEGLTVCAAENAEPVIRAGASGEIGINADGVTLTGLVLEAEQTCGAAVSSGGSGLTLRECFFRGEGAETGVVCPEAAGLTLEDCTFDGFDTAVSLSGNNVREEIDICGNTFTDCGCALSGTFTGQAGSALVFRENKVTGTAGKRCMLSLSDVEDTGAVIANLRDNSLTYVYATLENMEGADEVISAFSEKNELKASVLYDGTATEASAIPKTGERPLAVLWAGCVLLFGAGVVAVVRKAGKRRQ